MIENGGNENSNNRIYPIFDKLHASTSNESLGTTDRDFKILWQNLSFRVQKSFRKENQKKILSNLNGNLNSGEVMAILGPSGAGKSTLLECLCGRKSKGLSGELKISATKDVVIGFVPQTDYLLDYLTVKESVIFALHLNAINNSEEKRDCDDLANQVLKQFGLRTVVHTKAYRCSGGQRRRLSIALEVLAKPNILVLDEPTTGLDSPSSSHVISIMLELAANRNHRMAIVCTIHQPSIKIFNSFQKIYILSRDGRCIYYGTPLELIVTLSKLDLKCPEFTSPIDYVLEIASEDYGEQSVKNLAVTAKQQYFDEMDFKLSFKTLNSSLSRRSNQFWPKMFLLFKRSQVILYRDKFMTFTRVIMVLFAAFILSLIFGNKVGRTSGCLPKEHELWITPLPVLTRKFENDYFTINENICLIFLSIMVALLTGLSPVLLNFPREMLVFSKEFHNQWYSCLSYYTARVFSDIPFQIVLPGVYWAIIYSLTNQPTEFSRVSKVFLVSLLLSFCAQSIGEIVSAIWMNKSGVATFMGIILQLPMILFGGFLLRVSKMPVYLQPVSYFSVIRFAFEAILVSLYGFDRCQYQYSDMFKSINISTVIQPNWAKYLPYILSYIEKKDSNNNEREVSDVNRLYKIFGGNIVKDNHEINTSDSLVLGFYDVSDRYFYRAIAILVTYVVVLKISTYYVLIVKLKSQKT